VIIGGPGNDVLDGQSGDDVMEGGPGNDALTAGDGDDDLIGRPGADSFVGNVGDDVIVALDLEADTQINGGPGADTAYYDQGLDAAPLFVENPVVEDTTPPAVSCEPADGDWHADDVAVACTAEDPESHVPNPDDRAFELGTNVPAGSETADAATGTRDVCNGVDLCAPAGPVPGHKVDKRARAHSGSGRVGKQVRLRYRTADNTGRTRERITVVRAGAVVPPGRGRWRPRGGRRSSRFRGPLGAEVPIRSASRLETRPETPAPTARDS